MERPDGTRKARVIQVIETKALKGLGTEKDPAREVTQYWDLDGNRLAISDSHLALNNLEFEYKNVKESLALGEKTPELKLCKAVSRERKRNHLTITIEAEEPAEAKTLFKNLRKAIRKENRLLLGNISYEVDCKVRKNDISLNT